MVVLAPGATVGGFAAHVDEAAGSVQLMLTLLVEKPLRAPTATVYVALLPELTVTLVGAWGVIVKSGEPVLINLRVKNNSPPRATGLGSGGPNDPTKMK